MKVNQANMSLYNTQMDSGLVFNEPMPETLLSFYQSSLGCDPVSAKASNKDDSGLTYNVPAVAPRKRPRDSINDNFDAFHASQKTKVSPLPSFIDQELIFQIQQQQSETDRLIAEHVSGLLFMNSVVVLFGFCQKSKLWYIFGLFSC